MLRVRGHLLRNSLWAAILLAVALPPLAVRANDLSKPEDLYRRTDYQASLALLDKHAQDGPTCFLMGRDYFMSGDFKKAAEYLLRATNAEPKNAEYMDWLGRAYGKRAETSNPLFAPALASKARQAFERAIDLDPKDSDALSDLFDYYLNAPGFLGGGYDRAAAISDKIASVDPAEGYFVKAELAEKRKEFQAAEQHLRRAVAVAPHEVGHLIALAKLLANEGRTSESDAVFLQAEKTDPKAARVWFAQADVLIKQKRNLQEAKSLLEKYVRAPVTVDDPPKQDAVRLLKEVSGA